MEMTSPSRELVPARCATAQKGLLVIETFSHPVTILP